MNEDELMIEGYLKKQANGRYAINGAEFIYGECVEVKIQGKWVPMRFAGDENGYYLLGAGFSFYPRIVYARFY